MNDTHKIAVFGEDVHILYVAEMAQDSMLLPFMADLSEVLIS